MMTKKKQRTLAGKARRILRARADGRDKYARADRLLCEMREAGLKPGDEIPIYTEGERVVSVVLRDLYADQDKVFRSHGIGRFELEVLKASR